MIANKYTKEKQTQLSKPFNLDEIVNQNYLNTPYESIEHPNVMFRHDIEWESANGETIPITENVLKFWEGPRDECCYQLDALFRLSKNLCEMYLSIENSTDETDEDQSHEDTYKSTFRMIDLISPHIVTILKMHYNSFKLKNYDEMTKSEIDDLVMKVKERRCSNWRNQ